MFAVKQHLLVALKQLQCSGGRCHCHCRLHLTSVSAAADAGAAGGGSHMKLATTLFQNLFPTLNVTTVRLASCQVPPALAVMPRSWKLKTMSTPSFDNAK